MIGGIAANNSSACVAHGGKQLQDRGIHEARDRDGDSLDTADPVSKARFAVTHAALLSELSAIRPRSWPTRNCRAHPRKFKIRTPPATA